MEPLDIARICHEANRAYCVTLGDRSQREWDELATYEKEAALIGVQYRLDHPSASAADQHDEWMRNRLSRGWKYGPVRDDVAKIHPSLVPYDRLPAEQRLKDVLFAAVVLACAPPRPRPGPVPRPRPEDPPRGKGRRAPEAEKETA